MSAPTAIALDLASTVVSKMKDPVDLRDRNWLIERIAEDIEKRGIADELAALAEKHPGLFERALELEDNARPYLKTIEGLWRKTRKRDGRPGSWRAWAEREGLTRKEDTP
jgi:hypothetical protein